MEPVKIKDLMTRSFQTISENTSLQQIAGIMRRTRIDDLPVLDPESRLIGVVTKSSLLDAITAGKELTTPALNLMKRNVLTIKEDVTYDEVFDRIKFATTGSAIVVDDNERVVGVLTKASWITAMLDKEAYLSTQLNAILQTMHNGLITVDAARTITSINRAAATILKTNSETCVGDNIDSLLPGLTLDRVLILGTSSIGVEFWRDELSLILNISPIISENNITGAVIVFQDLTDLIKKISELESVTKLYGTLKSVMDIAYDGIIVVDDKRCVSMINQPALRFFRLGEGDIMGKPVDQIIDNKGVGEVVNTGVAIVNQLQFIAGTPYVISILPIMRKGSVIGAVLKILFQHLEEVKDLATKLENADQQLAYYRNQSLEKGREIIGFDQIVSADPVFEKIKEECKLVARGSSNILITGESGTGKELIAQAIHHGSRQASGPLVKVNCAAIPENLLESEFFGYAPGAFSGASKKGKRGKLLSAQGGTLFLDEIGDMSLSLQSKLLRVLQDKSFEPVGSNETIRVDVRIITATNQELEMLVDDGRFRSDLFYRLNVINFRLPPLRERKNDIKLLVHYFLEKYNRIFATRVVGIEADARQLLENHHWPGNVRELENVIERAINFAHNDRIKSDDLPLYLTEKEKRRNDSAVVPPSKSRLSDSRLQLEQQEILKALRQTNGNKAAAARLLGISRSWFYEKLSKMDLK